MKRTSRKNAGALPQSEGGGGCSGLLICYSVPSPRWVVVRLAAGAATRREPLRMAASTQLTLDPKSSEESSAGHLTHDKER